MEVSNQQGSKAKLNNSYDNYNQGKPICRSDCGQNRDEINDNISEKANSVQTSYKYQKKKMVQIPILQKIIIIPKVTMSSALKLVKMTI